MKLLARTITIRQALAVLIIGVFLFAATFSLTFGMQTDERGNMSGCPFMSEQASVCPMGVFEHIAKWQQLLTTTFSPSLSLVFLILLLLSFAFFAVFIHALNISLLALALPPPIFKNRPETKLYNYLAIAFSQGILNPRLYA